MDERVEQPAARLLEAGHVLVLHTTSLPDVERTRALAANWLTPAEHERLMRFIPDEARINFLAGRVLLRRTVGRLVNCEPRAVGFREAEHGKLQLAHPVDCGIQLNLSHTAQCVAAAFAQGRSVGVDVEGLDAAKATRSVARHSFTASENAALESVSEASFVRDFFRLWTLKEAYIKARGIGLGLPLDEFGFELPQEIGPDVAFSASSAVDPDPGRWRFDQIEIDGRWMLAVCAERPPSDSMGFVFREVSI